MRKLKFFLDPLAQVGPWLNKWENFGYILANVDKYYYNFKEDDYDAIYQVQYVGDFEIKELEGYKKYLQKTGRRYFHLPLDQGGLITGDLGFLRPFNKAAERVESTFSVKNRELLIIESPRNNPEEIDNNYAHVADEYDGIFKKYIASVLITILGIILVLRSIFRDGTRLLAIVALMLLAIFLVDFLILTIFSRKNVDKYRNLAKKKK